MSRLSWVVVIALAIVGCGGGGGSAHDAAVHDGPIDFGSVGNHLTSAPVVLTISNTGIFRPRRPARRRRA